MRESYLELKNRQQAEIDALPMFWAFSNEQFAEALEEHAIDKSVVYRLGRNHFCRISDVDRIYEVFNAHEQEHYKSIDSDLAGTGYIFEMFEYELNNHEYVVTNDVSDTVASLGLTKEDFEWYPQLRIGLRKAIKSVLSGIEEGELI